MDSKTFLKTIGQKIKAIRKSKGLTQEDIWGITGIHYTHLSDLENAKVNPSAYSLYLIAKALEVPLADLVNIPSGKIDTKIEEELAVLLSDFRQLDRKKQALFLGGSKGLLEALKKS